MTTLRQLFCVSALALGWAFSAHADAPVTAPSINMPEIIARAGQLVDVVIEDAELRVVTRATLMASAHHNQVVRARLEANGRMVMVRIIGPGQAVLDGFKPEETLPY